VKFRLLTTSAALSSFLLCAPDPGSAQRLDKTQPDWLIQKLEEGWRKAEEGVLQRNLEEGRTETLTYGEAGRRAWVRSLEERIRSLQQEHDAHPSPELAQAISSFQDMLARDRWSTAPDSNSLGSAAASCALSHVVEAAADPLPPSQAPGVAASAHASFQNSCGTLGHVYTLAYVRTTEASTTTTRTQEDGKNDGASLDSRAAASLGGSLDCYAQAIAQVSIPSQGLNYVLEDLNYSCPAPAPTDQVPFLGQPSPVPGTIKAADFDSGGEGVAYHDTTPGNSYSSTYRASDVDLYRDTVYYPKAGEWLEYTIDVETAGAYTLVAQVATANPGGSFHVELGDGSQFVNVTGPIAVPASGSGQSWRSALRDGVKLPAGRHVLRVVVDQPFDFLYALRFVVAQSPFGGAPKALPGTFKAVDFDEGGEQISYHDHTIGCRGSCAYRDADVDRWEQVVLWTLPGEWLEYTVDVATAGTYTLSVRAASDGGGGVFHIEVDGVDVTGPVTLPDTGSWNVYQTLTRPGVSLSAGRKVLRLVIDQHGGNADAGTFDTISILP
jgi:hypothetical protein